MRLFVDNLTNIDFSYLHPTRGLVGETWLVSAELHGELDSQGMICDFGVVKSMLRQWLEEEVDHRLVLPMESPALTTVNSYQRCDLTWEFKGYTLRCQCPLTAVTCINAQNVTPRTLAKWSIERLRPQFPRSVKQLVLNFYQESIKGPYYHYSHGLKKHAGNCQRIAHGHRSQILIWKNGELNEVDMRAWANRWRDIYIGTCEDACPASSKENQGFRYVSQQGEFYLEVPRSRCYMIETDSTIEFIALHIAEELKKNCPQDTFKVKAFEGLSKGAIVEI